MSVPPSLPALKDQVEDENDDDGEDDDHSSSKAEDIFNLKNVVDYC